MFSTPYAFIAGFFPLFWVCFSPLISTSPSALSIPLQCLLSHPNSTVNSFSRSLRFCWALEKSSLFPMAVLFHPHLSQLTSMKHSICCTVQLLIRASSPYSYPALQFWPKAFTPLYPVSFWNFHHSPLCIQDPSYLQPGKTGVFPLSPSFQGHSI